MDSFHKITLAKDIIATTLALILAAFGVWKYFDDNDNALNRERELASIRYIGLWSEAEIFEQRAELSRFWLENAAFVSYADKNDLSPRELESFIVRARSSYDRIDAFNLALFRVSEFFEQISYCHEAAICDGAILQDFFCPIIIDHNRAYSYFRELQIAEVGAKVVDPGQRRFLDHCARQSTV